jgi:hypothetical protein
MRANTSKADTVRGYFRKMNRVMMDHLKDRELHGVQKLADSHSLAIIDKEAATGTTFVAQLTLRNVFYMAKCKHLERMTLFSRSEAQKT